jgi:glucuronokinase
LEEGTHADLAALIDANFDVRRCIYPISRGNLRMIEAARSVGASAKFTGSGGAIVGTVPNEKTFPMLCSALEPMNVRVLRPQVRIAVPVS